MGRPCKCCGECTPPTVECYIEDDLVHIIINNAKTALGYYLDENNNHVTINLTDSLERGYIHHTIEFNDLKIISEYNNDIFYFLKMEASSSCGYDSCILTCSGSTVCQIYFENYNDSVVTERETYESFCKGEYIIGWRARFYPSNDEDEGFTDKTKFLINGQEVSPNLLFNKYEAKGNFYVNACDMPNAYYLTIESAGICSTNIDDTNACALIPSCVAKKNSFVIEIQNLPSELFIIYDYSSYNHNCQLTSRDITEITYKNINLYNGVHVFPKCDFSPVDIGYGTIEYIDINYSVAYDLYGNIYSSNTTRTTYIYNVIYTLSPWRLHLKLLDYNVTIVSDSPFINNRSYYCAANINTLDCPRNNFLANGGFLLKGNMCEIVTEGGRVYPRGTLPVNNNFFLQNACNANVLDPNGDIVDITEESLEHRRNCCEYLCYDGYNDNVPIPEIPLVAFGGYIGGLDDRCGITEVEYGWSEVGQIKNYYACL